MLLGKFLHVVEKSFSHLLRLIYILAPLRHSHLVMVGWLGHQVVIHTKEWLLEARKLL